jgi:hypothetical protein
MATKAPNERTPRADRRISGQLWIALTAIATIGLLLATIVVFELPRLETKDNRGSVAITTPANGQQFVRAAGLVMRGTARVPRGKDLWILVRAPGEGRYYVPSASPVSVIEKSWNFTVAGLGAQDGSDIGQQFDIVAVLSTRDASNALVRAAANDTRAGAPIEELPQGAEILANVYVTRAQ